MTWQRIDENTYIDDTLVTCSEYQLFVDEMREQGKYYQPDHWSSYEFPRGQAREPILGVRKRDAEIFCDWLSNQYEDDGRIKARGRFHLPDIDLSNLFPINASPSKSMGYWSTGVENSHEFKWIGTIPNNARNTEPNLATEIMQHPDLTSNAHIRSDPDFIRDSTINRYLDLDFARDRARYIIQDEKLNSIFGVANRDLSRYLRPRPELIDYAIDFTKKMATEYDKDHRSASDVVWDIYYDFFTLQERIAGHSPAFEGIRLVKKRIR